MSNLADFDNTQTHGRWPYSSLKSQYYTPVYNHMLLKPFPMEDKDLAISPRWYVSLGNSNPKSQVISNNYIGLVFHQKDSGPRLNIRKDVFS